MDRVTTAPATRSGLAMAAIAVMLESYDLTIYGLFALPIGSVFFPSESGTVSLLLAVGTLGVAYVMRPVGGVMLGAYADRAGRKAAIVTTVLLMSLSTGIIGLVPAYATVGILAPLLVVVARLAQGFSAGGAMAGTIAYLLESAPIHRRGLYASWQQTCQVGAYVFSVAIASIITNTVSAEGLVDWAWRVPFLLALALGPFGLYIRAHLTDPEIYSRAKARSAQTSTGKALLANRRSLLLGFGVSCLWNVTTFILLFYMPTYAQRELGLSAGDAFVSSTIGGTVLALCCPIVGLLSDRVGVRPPMLVGAVALVAATYPLLAFVHAAPSLVNLTVVQSALAVLIASYTAPVSAVLAGLFPTRSRSTGLSVAYNLSTLTAGAFGPLIVTSLIAATGDPLAPAYYVIAAASISALALMTLRDGSADTLHD